MEKAEIFKHWTDWASTFGTDLRATSKTWTIKALEIDALARGIEKALGANAKRILEVGCGNGINCVELAERFPDTEFDGIDFVPEMIDSARKNGESSGASARLRFFAGDVLKLEELTELHTEYDA
ncbi:MAG: class I SAM-dependent methyltransferase, partial [Pseudomonadota bacterium]